MKHVLLSTIPVSHSPVDWAKDKLEKANDKLTEMIASIPTPFQWAKDKANEKFQETVTNFLTEYITVLPIVVVVAMGVYMLFGMFSKTLGRLSVYGVVLYSLGVAVFA